MTAPIPENEAQRLEWLRQCAILDTLPETVFDDAALLAAQLCQVPTAAINLVDADRQWSKAAFGQDKTQDPRAVSFCAHTILQPDLLVVPDARSDTRFCRNPLVTGEPFIRFYAGAPLITSEGFGVGSLCVGSLCVVDRVPRRLSAEQTTGGEAAMNAGVHSGGGLGFVFLDECGTVQVRVEDRGGGIPLAELPEAALRRGDSTAGHGFKRILTTTDRVFLLTGWQTF